MSSEGGNLVDGSDVGTQLSLIVGAKVAWMNVDNSAVQNEDELWKYCNKYGSPHSLNMERVEIKFVFSFIVDSNIASINKEKRSAT